MNTGRTPRHRPSGTGSEPDVQPDDPDLPDGWQPAPEEGAVIGPGTERQPEPSADGSDDPEQGAPHRSSGSRLDKKLREPPDRSDGERRSGTARDG